ncbi:MAG: hypothetical protein IGS03_16590 [Candidatus Sericytochromatia bacterium]|nr:hypothetical protein [Candidatus Sericytochromatia bacterium]
MNSLLIDALPHRLEALLQAPDTPLICMVGPGCQGERLARQIADLRQKNATPAYRVIALADPAQQALLNRLNQGSLAASSAAETPNLLATSDPMVLRQAECILLDLSTLPPAKWPAQCRQIARRMAPEALLILIGSLPPGSCENTLLPLLQAAFAERGLSESPLLALLTPQPGTWFLAGSSPLAAQRARDFLSRLQPAETLMQQVSQLKSLEMLSTLFSTYRALSTALQQDWRSLATAHGMALEPLLAFLPWQMPPAQLEALPALPVELQHWEQILQRVSSPAAQLRR